MSVTDISEFRSLGLLRPLGLGLMCPFTEWENARFAEKRCINLGEHISNNVALGFVNKYHGHWKEDHGVFLRHSGGKSENQNHTCIIYSMIMR